MNSIFANPIVNLCTNTALVGIVAYASRSYIAIHPKHATLFALGTFLTSCAGRELIKAGGAKSNHFSGRAVAVISSNILPVSAAILFKVFSPIQALATLGLLACTTSAFHVITGESVWRI